MTCKEYLVDLERKEINADKVKRINEIYTGRFPEILKIIISNNDSSIFFDDGNRMLSYAEIVDAEKDLHVDFNSKGLIPIADCGDNVFIVFDYTSQAWAKFNIVDETLFKKRESLGDLLK